MELNELKKTRSFLRWAGSKQKLIPTLSKYWSNENKRYLEPFMGSAQFFFNLSIDNAILSDSNKDLIEVFNQIKRNPYPVFRILSEFKVNSREYYRIRNLTPAKLGINQRAARFIYLNRLCFNGLYRTNLKGEFNVPYSGEKPKILCDYENLKAVSHKLQKASILHGDFEQIVTTHAAEGDFIYLDPPYAIENVRIFKQYGPSTFGLQDLERLKDLLKEIDKRKAKFLLSYALSDQVVEMFSSWNQEIVITQRNIAGFAKYRRTANELLVTNIKQS